MEIRKAIEKISEIKNCFLKKINKIGEPLARQRDKTQIKSVRKEDTYRYITF